MNEIATVLIVSGSVAGLAMLLVAALHDILARTVPNQLAIAIAAAGLVSQVGLEFAGTGHLGWSLLAALIVFVLAALLWRRGLMGGGDVKLLAAAALLMPPLLVPSMLAAVSLAGGLLAFVYLSARHRLPRSAPGRPVRFLARALRVERWRLRRGGPLPYAVAIAGGVCFVLTHGGFS